MTEISTPKKNLKWGMIFCILLLVLIFLFGLYKFNWHGGLTRTIVKVVPLPIARVGWNFITYKEFDENLLFLEKYYENFEERRPQKTDKLVLDKLIQEALIKKLVKKYNVITSKQEIKTASLTLLPGYESEEELEKQLEEIFDWSLKKYQKKVVRPYLEQQKLADKISTDAEINKEQLDKAKDVLWQIKNGELTFEFAAQIYSQDQKTAPNGGDLGKKSLAEFSDKIILTIKDLEIGEISDIIKINGGYYILKLHDRDEESDTYQVRQIYFKTKNLSEFLKDYRKKMTVKIYGKI